MCQKHQHRCQARCDMAEEALQQWAVAETLPEVRRAWARLGGRTTLHRYGREHFRLLALHRHGDPQALGLLAARMQRRGGDRLA